MKKPNDDFYLLLAIVIVFIMFIIFMFGDGTIVVGCPAPSH